MKSTIQTGQALNLSSQCLQFWREKQLAEHFEAMGDLSMARALQSVAQRLWNAPKFLLPEGGRPCDDVGSLARMLTSARLPFPVVALEYQVGHDAPMGNNEARSTRRIALASEEPPPYITGQRRFSRSLFVQPIACFELEGESIWTVVNAVVEVDLSIGPKVVANTKNLASAGILDATYLSLRQTQIEQHIERKQASAIFGSEVHQFGSTFLEQFNGDHARALSTLAADANDEVLAAISFACLSACANVSVQNLPAPAALNRKRAKTGKVPMFDVRVLMVADSGAYLVEDTDGVTRGGTHASPRAHLRRGHIRMLSSQRSVWVNAAVVNAHRSGEGRAVPTPEYAVQRSR